MVFLYNGDSALYPASYRNLSAAGDEKRQLQGKQGIVAEAIHSATAILGQSPASDPELPVFRSLLPCKSMLCVPLRAGFEVYGAVLFASVQQGVYTSQHGELLGIFNQATITPECLPYQSQVWSTRSQQGRGARALARDLRWTPQDVAHCDALNFARLLVERDPVRARRSWRPGRPASRSKRSFHALPATNHPGTEVGRCRAAVRGQYPADDGPVMSTRSSLRCREWKQGVVFAIWKGHQQRQEMLRPRASWFAWPWEICRAGDRQRHWPDVRAVESGYGRGSLGMINLGAC
jgi:hypothetical protein